MIAVPRMGSEAGIQQQRRFGWEGGYMALFFFVLD
jgi:hypothetical protein